MNRTDIEWTTYTSNPIRAYHLETGKRGWFCVHASDGCANCYAERWNGFRGNGLTFIQPNARKVRFELDTRELESWIRCKESGTVFVCDMCDLFLPEIPEWMIAAVFGAMSLAGHLTFQVLTKRAKRMRELLSRWTLQDCINALSRTDFVLDSRHSARIARQMAELGRDPQSEAWPLQNVWCGVSAENQRALNERGEELANTPAVLRFLSCEPLLGPLRFGTLIGRNSCGHCGRFVDAWTNDGFQALCPYCAHHDSFWKARQSVHWVIGGGESGPAARPCHPEWARGLRDQCQAIRPVGRVRFFWKQWGEWAPQRNEPFQPREYVLLRPDGRILGDDEEFFSTDGVSGMGRVGKKAAGRTLDGRTWDEMPEVTRG